MRFKRSLALLRRSASYFWPRTLFMDEKLFTVEQSHNTQNDRSWSAEAPAPSSIVTHSHHPRLIMVWGGICATGKTPLIFVDVGVKVNQHVYLRDILEAVVLLWSNEHFGDQ